MRYVVKYIFFITCVAVFGKSWAQTGEAKKLKEKAGSFLYNNNDSLAYYANSGIKLARAEGDSSTLSGLYIMLATAGQINGDLKSADSYADTAISIARKADCLECILSGYNIKGLVQEYQGNYEAAAKQHLKGLKLAEKNNLPKFVGNASVNMGNLYLNEENRDQGMPYFKRAITAFKEAQHTSGLMSAYIGVANVYNISEIPDSAIYYYNKAIDEPEAEKYVGKLAYAYGNAGVLYIKQKRYDESLHFVRKAHHFSDVSGNVPTAANMAVKMARIFINKNMPDSARKYLNFAIPYTNQNITTLTDDMEMYQTMYFLDSLDGNYQKALAWQTKYVAAYEKILSDQNSEKLKEITVKYEAEKKDLENERLRQENDIFVQQQRIEAGIRNNLITGIAALLAVLGLISYVAHLRKKQLDQRERLLDYERKQAEQHQKILEAGRAAKEIENEFLQKEIVARQQELVNQDLLMAAQNQKLTNYKTELLEAAEQGSSLQVVKKAQQIAHDMDNYINGEQNWQLFLHRFNQIQPGFLERLADKHNKLSKTDLQMCAYFRINRSTQEIADVLNINVNSVFRARQRLKKKLSETI